MGCLFFVVTVSLIDKHDLSIKEAYSSINKLCLYEFTFYPL